MANPTQVTRSRFELSQDGQTSYLEFETDSQGWLTLWHTEVPEARAARALPSSSSPPLSSTPKTTTSKSTSSALSPTRCPIAPRVPVPRPLQIAPPERLVFRETSPASEK